MKIGRMNWEFLKETYPTVICHYMSHIKRNGNELGPPRSEAGD
jgi:hypothetical protein